MSAHAPLLQRFLDEDAPWGDVTTESLLPEGARMAAALRSRAAGVASGLDIAAEVFALVDSRVEVERHAAGGDRIAPGDVLLTVAGPAAAILRAERVALNLAQRLSGVATLTARFVDAVAGTRARIADTRKTTPGLRALERRAVRDGGGVNHRFSLSDAVLVKDNHLAAVAATGVGVGAALRALRDRVGHTVVIEVEVDRLDQLPEVLDAGVDAVLLDNFALDDLRAGVELVAGRAVVEASGGVDLDTVAAIAATGVDLVSVGALTHSAPALDLGLDVEHG